MITIDSDDLFFFILMQIMCLISAAFQALNINEQRMQGMQRDDQYLPRGQDGIQDANQFNVNNLQNGMQANVPRPGTLPSMNSHHTCIHSIYFLYCCEYIYHGE